MPNLNNVVLMGNLTRDPQVTRIGAKNTAVAELSLAINRKWNDRASGEQKEEVTFVDIKAWGRTAEVCEQYAHKGRAVAIEGRISLDMWEDKETGKKRQKCYVTAERVHLLGQGKNDNKPAATQPQEEEEDAFVF